MTDFDIKKQMTALERRIKDLEDELKKVRDIAERALRKARNL